jgi:hypothetical protein
VISLLTGVTFGLAPAFQAVKFGSAHGTQRRRAHIGLREGRSRLRSALVIAEVSLSLVLLTGAGLLIRSFWHLQHVDTGFRAEQLLTMRLFPPASTYTNEMQVAAFYEKLLERVRSLPSVKDAAAGSGVPIGDRNPATLVQIDGKPFEQGAGKGTEFRVVTPDYFRTLGVRLVRGRFLDDSDQQQTVPVAVVNESMARDYWPNEDPLGRRFRLLDSSPERARTVFLSVVGVVADVKNRSLTDVAGQEVFVPLRQRARAVAGMGFAQPMTLAVRTSGEPEQLVKTIRQEVWALDPNIHITGVKRWSRFGDG